MTSRRLARVLIADDHKLIADACRKLLEPHFDVVGVVTDGREAVQATADLCPTLVIMDVFMPQMNGLEAGEQIKGADPVTKLLYLTMDPSPDLAVAAFRRGASGYVLKNCAAHELILAAQEVLCGRYYLSPLITRDAVEFLLQVQTASSSSRETLTKRQREILHLHGEWRTL